MDVRKTKHYYDVSAGDYVCTCEYCRNYVKEIRHAYPELSEYLETMGIDIEKPFETMPIEPDESGNPLKILCSDGKGKVKYRYEFTYDEQGYRTSSVSYRGEATKVCRIVYEPNMQECRQASLTVYNPDGSVKSEETTDDMKKLEIPSVGKEE